MNSLDDLPAVFIGTKQMDNLAPAEISGNIDPRSTVYVHGFSFACEGMFGPEDYTTKGDLFMTLGCGDGPLRLRRFIIDVNCTAHLNFGSSRRSTKLVAEILKGRHIFDVLSDEWIQPADLLSISFANKSNLACEASLMVFGIVLSRNDYFPYIQVNKHTSTPSEITSRIFEKIS